MQPGIETIAFLRKPHIDPFIHLYTARNNNHNFILFGGIKSEKPRKNHIPKELTDLRRHYANRVR